MLGSITAHHLRMLCESGWEGGAGYTPQEVGQMTLDQIWFRLCDANILKRKPGGRTEKHGALQAAGMLKQDKDGMVKGRAADGTKIRGRIRGKSLARELMEKEAARLEKEKRMERCKRRKGG